VEDKEKEERREVEGGKEEKEEKRRRRRRRAVGSREAVSPRELCQPITSGVAQVFCWFLFPSPGEKWLFDPNMRFHREGFFWLKACFFSY